MIYILHTTSTQGLLQSLVSDGPGPGAFLRFGLKWMGLRTTLLNWWCPKTQYQKKKKKKKTLFGVWEYCWFY
jgi:hypothetical protein